MRPITLKLKGINSYRKEQVIDFATLTSEGLFGIFGPTGSGKSSILDSITLALYAKLSRGTKNFINLNEKSASVSFLFSITTDKTRTYLVERTFRYHTGSGAPTVRNTGGRLIEYKTYDEANGSEENYTVLADRPTEVTAECTRLLGLTSDDFMRTVVLPQGQFGEFLQLKGKERRSMLQRIFHLEKYGLELTGKVARARQKQELLLSQLEGERKAYENTTADSVAALKKQEQESARELSFLSEKKQSLEEDFRRADEIRKLIEEKEPLLVRQQKNAEKLPQIKAQEERLKTSERANLVRPFALQAEEAAKTLNQAVSALEKAQQDASAASSAYESARKEQEEARRIQEEKQVFFAQREQLLSAALQTSETLSEWTARLKENQEQEKQARKEFSSLTRKRESLLSREQDIRQKMQTLEKEIDSETVSSERKQLLEDGHIREETYREKKKLHEKAAKSIQTARQELALGQNVLQAHQQKLSALEHALSKRQEAAGAELKNVQAILLSVKEERETVEKERQKWQTEHMADFIRSQLKEGEPCPVCGSPFCASSHKATPENSAETPQAINAPSQAEKTSSQAAKDPAPGSTADFKARLAAADFKAQLAAIDKKEEQLKRQQSALEREITLLDNNLNAISKLSGIPEYRENSPLPDELPDSDEIASLLSAYAGFSGQLEKQKTELDRQNREFQEEYKSLKKYGDQIIALRDANDIQNFSEELAQLRKKETLNAAKESELKNLRTQNEQLLQEKETLSGRISVLEQKLSAAASSIKNCEDVIAGQQKAFPEGLAPDMDFKKEIISLRKEKETQKARTAQKEAACEKARLLFQKKREELSFAKSREETARVHASGTSELLAAQKRRHGFAPDEDLSPYYMEETTLKAEQAQIEEYYRQSRETEDHLVYLTEKLAGREMTKEDWLARKEAFVSAEKNLKELESTVVLLKHQLATEETRLGEKEKLEKIWTAECRRKDRIKELEQLFKGNAFIEYVAQSRLTYIAKEASAILTRISGGSYALEISETSEFVIRDNRNGGIRRPSDTLSGGEIFITSLSLALALSSSIQLNGSAPLEFFFLDEGFGSLDDDLLDTVMTSLERLQNRKRSIGIISHVETIQARVPVKLIVAPSDLSQSGSSIRLEYS